MRKGEVFLKEQGQLLGSHGYTPDGGQLERTADGIVFYHYTRQERLEKIFSSDGGLNARLSVVCPSFPSAFEGCYEIQGFLELLPAWLTESQYFGDLGYEMVKQYVGHLPLRIEVPTDFPGLYIADYAHILECKHFSRRGRTVLGLGYHCTTGHEAGKAYLHSYIPATDYEGGHVAPVMHVVRKGQGLVIPSQYIRVEEIQALLKEPGIDQTPNLT